jgi:hypothetical protein
MKVIVILSLSCLFSFNSFSQKISNKDSLIFALTKQVLTSIKNRDFKKFASYIHPAFGVRFSPSAYIDTSTDIKLTSTQFINAVIKKTKINWGTYDPSGDTIFLTITDYFKEFVYDVNFLNAEKSSVNKIINEGNTLNNLNSIYHNCDFSESYFSGFEKKYGGMDWRSLRLVFKKYNNRYFLIGVIHDQWTI